MSGNGHLETPWDLATALTNPGNSIKPAHVVHLMNGSAYVGDFVDSSINGVLGSVVTFQPYQVARVIINGSFTLSGRYLVLNNIRIYDASFTDRVTEIAGDNPADILSHDGVFVNETALNNKYYGLIVHDTKEGVLVHQSANPTELYWMLIYYNGWAGPDYGHGHGVYAGNRTDGTFRLVDSVIHSQFGYGLHCYGAGPGETDGQKNHLIEGNTLFWNGCLYNPLVNNGNILGGGGIGSTTRNAVFRNNCLYQDKLNFGSPLAGSMGLVLTNNIIVGDVQIRYFGTPPTIMGNLFYGDVTIVNGDTETEDTPATDYPDNTYQTSGVPDVVNLRANEYDATKAKLTIFNGLQANTVTVDVSSIYANGTQVQARNVQDYFVDIQTLTVTAGNIAVNMQAANRSVQAPQGRNVPATTFPAFGCFVIEAA